MPPQAKMVLLTRSLFSPPYFLSLLLCLINFLRLTVVAVAQDVHNQEEAWEEDEAKQAYPWLDPSPYR